MKTAIHALLTTVAMSPAAAAAEGAGPEGVGLLTILFLALGAAILVFQFVPAVALFGSMIYGLFAAGRRRSAAATGEETHERA